MAYEARAVANALLDCGDEMGLSITHMALHKIAFHTHGWHLARMDKPIVTERFEAWEHGPVLPSVYAAFKIAGRSAITFRAERFDPATQRRFLATANFPTDVRQFFRDMIRAYGRFDALTLSDMTHRSGDAWDRVWNARNGRITLAMRISDDEIRGDFLRRARHCPIY